MSSGSFWCVLPFCAIDGASLTSSYSGWRSDLPHRLEMGYVTCYAVHSQRAHTLLCLVFYIVAILVLPLCVLAVVVLPNSVPAEGKRQRRVDVPGVFALTGGLVLFVYAISDANHVGTSDVFFRDKLDSS